MASATKTVDLNKLKANKKKFNPGPARSRGGIIANFLFLCAIGFVMFIPMLYVFCNAFKPMDELFLFPPKLLFRNPTIANFKSISTLMSSSWVPFSRYIFNTVFVTVVATFFHILLASLAAYVLEKRDFPGRNFMSKLIVLSLMFTPAVTTIPNYIIQSKLGMIDTYWVMIIPYVGSSMGLYLMKQFMASSIPNVLLEAARIDGASELRIFSGIVMPLVKPAWLTMLMTSVQSMWGITASTTVFTEAKKPLQYALSQIAAGGIARTGSAAAISLIMILPPLIIFIFSQTQILDTMASSGIKE